MPLLNVNQSDPFRYSAELVTPDEWFYAASTRRVTAEEWVEIQRLQQEAARLETLLQSIYDRPAVDLDEMTPEERRACITEEEIAFGRD